MGKRWMSAEDARGRRRQCIMGRAWTNPVHGLCGAPPVGVGWEFLVEAATGVLELPELPPVCLRRLQLLFLGGVEDNDGAGVGAGVPDCLKPSVPVEAVATKADAASISVV
jgi:hypothetical protein